MPQCGYCQSGQVMTAAALLGDTPNPTEEDIRNSLTNLCRCGTLSGHRPGGEARRRHREGGMSMTAITNVTRRGYELKKA